MPSMRIFSASNPFIQTYSFKLGDKINIQVNFETGFPDRYRLQIIDHKNNSRLNRYGRGMAKITVENWPVPLNIREDHFGIWFVKIDDISNRLGESNSIVGIMKQIFFVEKDTRIDIPVISEREVIEKREIAIKSDSLSEEVTSEQEIIEPSVLKEERPLIVDCPVTDIRGIGKSYAERLKKIQVESVSDFWNYQDRISLAEIMRISDKRLEKMIQEAEIILSEEADGIISIELEKSEEIVPDDLTSVGMLGVKTIRKLEAIGVKNKSDLLNFEDISILRTTINTSSEDFRSILASVGKIIEPDDVRKPIPVEVSDQPVTSVKGIGQVTARKLNSVRILTVKQLIESNFDMMKEISTKKQYQKWDKNASSLLKIPVKIEIQSELHETTVNKLLSLPGIGPKTLEKLNALNISTKADLSQFEDQEILRKTLRMSAVRFNAFIKSIK
ncbi:MAG: helix-hairpin-helix domain-containing protein [Candidatus Hodarchaeales archaeon]